MAPQLKKIILFTCLLTAALACLDRYVQYLLKKCPQGNIAKVNHVMQRELNAEVTIWGASTARVNFDTPLMGKKLNMECFNVGLDGTPFHQYEGLLREYISYSKPSLLILVIDINGFGERKSLYQGYAWLHYIDNDNIYHSIKSIDRGIAVKSRYIPLYSLTTYDRRFLIRCLKWVYMGADSDPELDNAGYHPIFISWQTTQRRLRIKPFEVEIDQDIVASVYDLVKEAAKKNVQVALVIPPCYVEATKFISNRKEFEEALESMEQQNVRLFNYLDSSITLEKSNFTNNTHLNSTGSNLLTSQFIGDLKNWINSNKSTNKE